MRGGGAQALMAGSSPAMTKGVLMAAALPNPLRSMGEGVPGDRQLRSLTAASLCGARGLPSPQPCGGTGVAAASNRAITNGNNESSGNHLARQLLGHRADPM